MRPYTVTLSTGETKVLPLDFRNPTGGVDLAVSEAAIGTLTYVVEYIVGYNPYVDTIPDAAWVTIAPAGVAPNVSYTVGAFGPFPTALRMRATGGAGSVTGKLMVPSAIGV